MCAVVRLFAERQKFRELRVHIYSSCAGDLYILYISKANQEKNVPPCFNCRLKKINKGSPKPLLILWNDFILRHSLPAINRSTDLFYHWVNYLRHGGRISLWSTAGIGFLSWNSIPDYLAYLLAVTDSSGPGRSRPDGRDYT